METIRKTDSRRGAGSPYEVAGLAWLAGPRTWGGGRARARSRGDVAGELACILGTHHRRRMPEAFGRARPHAHAAGARLGAAPTGTRVTAGWENHLSLLARALAAKPGGANRADCAEATPASSPRESWGHHARERIAGLRVFPPRSLSSGCAGASTPATSIRLAALVADASAARDVGAARARGDLWNGSVMWTPDRLIDPPRRAGTREDLCCLCRL